MSIQPSSSGFQGLQVGALESRMAQEMSRLIIRHGGVPHVAPSMRELPLSENPEALAFGKELIAGTIDMLVLLTGVGFRTLLDVLQTRFPLQTILDALQRTTLVTRGPKPISVLKDVGLAPHVIVPEPNTWKDILDTIDQNKPEGLNGVRLAVQEYGTRNEELLTGLTQRGAHVVPVPVYRWTLPRDVQPLKELLQAVSQNHIDVLLITNAVQIDHAVKVLEDDARIERFRTSLRRMVVASIGPVASERLRQYHFPVDIEPSHSKMGILVKETSQAAHRLLFGKRQTD
ncbi:MAG: uroporphyrinogen-III synthase [Nitrospirales bacterium]|nr:uroporphyrinogen-III synthase [Nitrospirales bacterium]